MALIVMTFWDNGQMFLLTEKLIIFFSEYIAVLQWMKGFSHQNLLIIIF